MTGVRILAGVALTGVVMTGGLAGCGSSAPADRAADLATAQAVNLTVKDLPDFQPGPAPDSGEASSAVKLAHCVGAPVPAQVDVVDLASPTFTAAVGQTQEQFSSEVAMVRTEADGRADLAALRRPRLASCISADLAPELRAQLPTGTSLGSLDVSHFDPPGLVGGVGVRIRIPVTATVGGASAQVELTDDLVRFLVGRAEITLMARSTGTVDLGAQETRLTALLVGRARRTHQAA